MEMKKELVNAIEHLAAVIEDGIKRSGFEANSADEIERQRSEIIRLESVLYEAQKRAANAESRAMRAEKALTDTIVAQGSDVDTLVKRLFEARNDEDRVLAYPVTLCVNAEGFVASLSYVDAKGTGPTVVAALLALLIAYQNELKRQKDKATKLLKDLEG